MLSPLAGTAEAQPACGSGPWHVGESCRQPDGAICSVRGYQLAGTFDAVCTTGARSSAQAGATRPFVVPDSCGAAPTSQRNVEVCTAALADTGRSAPVRHWLLNSRGLSHLAMRKVDLALADFNEAIALKPGDANAYAFRSYLQIYFRPNVLDAALADAEKAIEVDPDFALAYVMRAVVATRKGQHDAAIADADTALRLAPKLVLALQVRGGARLGKSDADGAIADYTAAIRLAPLDFSTYNMRGLAHQRKSDLSAAIADFSQSLAVRPGQIMAHINRARAHLANKEPDKARADFQLAVALTAATPAETQAQAAARSALIRLDSGDTSASGPGDVGKAAKGSTDGATRRETKAVALAGARTRIGLHYLVERDCRSAGVPTIQLKQLPASGTAEAVTGQGFPSFPASNPRSACNAQQIEVTQLWYTPNKDFAGEETVEYTVFYPNGTSTEVVARVRVEAAATPPPAPKAAPTAQATEEIAITQPGRILVQVSVNGVAGSFLLDTGASFVSVTAAFAAKAKIAYDKSAVVRTITANGTVESYAGRAERIQLRSLQARDVMVIVQPASRSGFGPNIDGLLGLSFLSRFDVSIGEKRVRISARAK